MAALAPFDKWKALFVQRHACGLKSVSVCVCVCDFVCGGGSGSAEMNEDSDGVRLPPVGA